MTSPTTTPKAPKRRQHFLLTLLFMLIGLVFVLIFLTQRKLYYHLLWEDGLIEWLTFASLFISSGIALVVALHIKKKQGYLHWFFICFCLFALLAGMEEISWGQRVFGIQSNEFFNKYNDQQETNLHNTFQGVVGIKTKHIALLLLLVYGVLMPYAARQNWPLAKWLQTKEFVFPPGHLALPFVIATGFMIDFPSGMEEEIGEFFYSLCFVFFMMHRYRHCKKNGFAKTPAPD